MAAVTYRRSIALDDWTGTRRAELQAIEDAYRHIAGLVGRRGAASRGRDQLAAAFVVRMYAEFQGFVRELHDQATFALVRGTRVPPEHFGRIVEGLSDGRRLDQGNATLDAVRRDFRRIGLVNLGAELAARNRKHAIDKARYEDFTSLRNALAHGNAEQLRRLRSVGPRPSLSWGRSTLPSLNRMARALDRAVWDHVRATYPAIDPWGTT